MINLFAGGIRNPCSTSYINSILQFLLHFKPMINLLSDSQYSKNYLVRVLYRLYIKLKETPNNISADSLISYFQIDPRYSSDVLKFISLLYSNLPSDFQQVIFVSELISVETPTTISQLASNLSGSSVLNTHEMIIFKVKAIESYDQLIILNPDDQIFINDCNYQLYGFVQSRGTQYHLIMNDSKGWINCNDSSLSSISTDQVTKILSDSRMPIELIIFIKTLEMVEFSRRKPVFQNIRSTVNFSSAQSTQEDSQSLIPSISDYDSVSSETSQNSLSSILDMEPHIDKYDNKENQLITKRDRSFNFIKQSKIIKRTSDHSSFFDFGTKTQQSKFLDSNNSLLIEEEENKIQGISDQEEEDDDDVILISSKAVESDNLYLIGEYINPKTNEVIKRYKLETSNYKIAAEKIKFHIESEYHENIQYYFKIGLQYTKSIPPSSERKAYAIFRPINFDNKSKLQINYSNQEKNENANYDISIKIIGTTTNQIYRQFKGNQKLSDVKTLIELYTNSQTQNIYFFITINKKEFKIIDENKQIKELWRISNHQIELTATLDPKNTETIALYRIPIYQTFGRFKLIKYISLYINIDDTCYQLTEYAKKYINSQLEVMRFDDIKKQFVSFEQNEKLYKVFHNSNLRIQPPIPKDSIVFLYEIPFAYSIKDNQLLKNLTKEIKSYLGLNKDISLEYNQRISDYIQPKAAWKKGLYKFMIVKSH